MAYNGWKNYDTWNVMLWINNDPFLYSVRRSTQDYDDFLSVILETGNLYTPDGVPWFGSEIDRDEINFYWNE